MAAVGKGHPAVSVIVPYFNVGPYVADCVGSLLAQTCGDFEAVFVDDGSTDGSAEMVRAAAGGDGRFRFAALPANKGQSAARNVGLDMAQGAYVLFLDADDLYDPQALEMLLGRACADDLDCLDFSARSFTDGAGQVHGFQDDYSGRDLVPGVMSGPELFCRYQQLRQYYCSPCLHLMRRRMLEDAGIRFLEGYVHEDELFSPVMHAHAQRAAFERWEVYLRRVRPGSTMTSGRGMRNVACMFRMSQELASWLSRNAEGHTAQFCDAMAQRIFELREIAAIDAANVVAPDELDAWTDTLAPSERIDFDLFVRQPALGYRRALDEARASRSFRLGSALLAGPIWLKDHLQA